MGATRSASTPKQPSRRWRRRLLLGVGASVVLLVGAYVFLTGPRDLSRYPARESSAYKLPWPAGQTRLCVQSNRGIVSHRGAQEFAFDFKMPEGSDVCASRGGVVTAVVIDHDGHGLQAPNNYIAIDHGDGTSGWYLHLQKGGSLVEKGQRVAQGQRIGRSGHVGRSLTPHLHFHVRDNVTRTTIPFSFADVNRHRGVPRMGFSYESANKVKVQANRLSAQILAHQTNPLPWSSVSISADPWFSILESRAGIAPA